MKGYINGNTLYIFPQEAGAIPYVDPEVTKIAVQPDEVIAFKEANELYANMIYPYNYWTMTVKAKAWAGHENDDIEVPGYTFTLTGNNIEDKLGVKFNGVDQEMLYEWTDVAPDTVITIVPTEAPGYYTINEQEYVVWDNENNCWTVEMPEDDLTVTINYTGDGSGESGAS